MRLISAHPLLAFLLVPLAFSGCAEPATPQATISSSAAPATVSDNTGGIEGMVNDDESRPVAGATIALTGTSVQGKTAADGRFSFSDLNPGDYSLFAQALGYDSLARKVAVTAGAVTDVTLILTGIEVIDERQESFEYAGFLGFGIVTPVVRVPTWIVCQDTDLLCDQDKYYFETNITEGIATVVDALVWESTAPASSKTLQLRVRPDAKDRESAEGRSPVLVRYDEPEAKKIISHQVITDFTSTNPDEAVQVYYQQKFKIYSTIFWGAAAPADYSPLPK